MLRVAASASKDNGAAVCRLLQTWQKLQVSTQEKILSLSIVLREREGGQEREGGRERKGEGEREEGKKKELERKGKRRDGSRQ